MPTQLSLLDQTPLARNSDPRPSHRAAAEVMRKLGRCQLAVIDAVRRLGPCTALEAGVNAAEADPSSNAETYRKRVRECVASGRIVECGERLCRVTGKLATTFEVR